MLIISYPNFSFALVSKASTNLAATLGANFVARPLYTGFEKLHSTPKETVVSRPPFGINVQVAFNR